MVSKSQIGLNVKVLADSSFAFWGMQLPSIEDVVALTKKKNNL